jgi:hypothetical protein
MPSLLWKAGSSLRESVNPLVQGAWAERLMHFSRLDVTGPTAGAVARLLMSHRDDVLVRPDVFPLSRVLD